jgi:flavin-dependent dehydrogenase
VATLAAQKGVSVELFERETFPRFHIGESLIPETFWVLERLGMLDKLKRTGFVRKYSVQFVSDSGKLSQPFYFRDNRDHECSDTWQVRRSEFDQLMLDNARAQGVHAHEGARVRQVIFEGDRAVGVSVRTADDVDHVVRAKVVVDASGQSAFLQNRLKLMKVDDVLKKGAVWTYFKGAIRDTAERDTGATLVMQTKGRKGWFWFIPLHDDITSIGVVSDFRDLFDGRDHEAIFAEQLTKCVELQRRLVGAERTTGFYATKDYSYKATQSSGDGWVLVGDAYGFLDPLYSSGVLLALKSGELAADAIVDGLAVGDTSRAMLGRWEAKYNRGMDRMRRLVCEFYDDFNFGSFVRAHPYLKGRITDLLIGDLFDDEKFAEFEARLDETRAEINAMKAAMTAESAAAPEPEMETVAC